jgi:O-antigen/teichoic acid export membrane protein
MVLISWLLGRRYYPVPYDLRRVAGYISSGLIILLLARWATVEMGLHRLVAGTLGMTLYLAIVAWFDGRRLVRDLKAS